MSTLCLLGLQQSHFSIHHHIHCCQYLNSSNFIVVTLDYFSFLFCGGWKRDSGTAHRSSCNLRYNWFSNLLFRMSSTVLAYCRRNTIETYTSTTYNFSSYQITRKTMMTDLKVYCRNGNSQFIYYGFYVTIQKVFRFFFPNFNE